MKKLIVKAINVIEIASIAPYIWTMSLGFAFLAIMAVCARAGFSLSIQYDNYSASITLDYNNWWMYLVSFLLAFTYLLIKSIKEIKKSLPSIISKIKSWGNISD